MVVSAAPRLCHMMRWSHYNGYGFSVHTDKKSSGQFIRHVEAGSPAEAAGLKEGDRIIEVNGVNVCEENHQQVVERIRKDPKETRLLVVDSATDAYYRGTGMIISSNHERVIFMTSGTDESLQGSSSQGQETEAAGSEVG